MSSEVVPLAIAMMAGPPIMAALVFITHERAVRVSLAFVAGVAVAMLIGIGIATVVVGVIGDNTDLGSPSDSSSTGSVIQLVLIGVLIVASLAAYFHRRTSKPPKWLDGLLGAGTLTAFGVGMIVVLLPGDLMLDVVVTTHLEHGNAAAGAALPFIVAVILIAALPLIAYAILNRRAAETMPKVRTWMNVNSWVVSILVYLIFIFLILA